MIIDNLEFPFLYCHNIESASRCIARTEIAPDITLRDLPQVSAKELVVQDKIGVGGFGAVYKGILKPNIDIAVKELNSKTTTNSMDEGQFREFQKEAYIQSLLDHPNIVKLHGVISSPPRMILQLITGYFFLYSEIAQKNY